MASIDQQAILADLQAQLQANRARLNSGVTSMAENGRSMAFSLPEIRRNITRLEAEIARLTGAQPMVRRILCFTTKGL